MKETFKNRYAVLYAFAFFFLVSSFLLRIVFLCLSIRNVDLTLLTTLNVLGKGLVYDIGVLLYFSLFYSTYLLLLPHKLNSTYFNYFISYLIVFVMVMIAVFSFFAEFTFWQEFESRFNFIAVDYLVYTYEVVNNINESYPLPYLIGGVLAISLGIIFLFKRKKYFNYSFYTYTRFSIRILHTLIIISGVSFYAFWIDNSWAEKSSNRYRNELSKAGIYSFVSAFKSNELNYEVFYPLINNEKAFAIIRKDLKEAHSNYSSIPFSIRRDINEGGVEKNPNVIMVVIESFSAEFMESFGNQQKLTPVLDSIVSKSILFTNMFATGTRTVRGMEALSLAIPPTPGNSIVRRKNNANLITIGSIFRKKGYQTTFFYGGDGYFDNMNQYFGSNGFDIIDRGRDLSTGDSYQTKRTVLTDEEVDFENAWGVSDEDLFEAVLKDADNKYSSKKLFYNFVMTTSNHRPFTYPEGKISIPSGSGRDGAVKYSDYAIGSFLKEAAKKPWFKNTVFIFVGDHCASSAGKNEIDIAKYHIPAVIYNLPLNPRKIDKMCSQIDLYPTLFGLLNWSYKSNNYGQNVLHKGYNPRILLGTYQKLGYMKNDSLIVLSPKQQVQTFFFNKLNNEQKTKKVSQTLVDEAIAYYQSAYYLYKHGGLKEQ